MKFDNVTDIILVLCVFVPGFIFDSFLSNFIQQREKKSKEIALLKLLTASAINYVICSPIIYYLLSGFWATSPVISAVLWFFIILCMPIMMALLAAIVTQKGSVGVLAKFLNLRYIDPIPTAWDCKFSRLEPCYLLITLKDGTEIAGYFGENSFSSSISEDKDIYLEETYKISNNKWIPVKDSYGLWISGEQISFIEFIK